MKEFVVCYTLVNEIKREKIIKERHVKKEEILHEILEKIAKDKYLIVKTEQGNARVNTSLIRYIRVSEEKQCSPFQSHQPKIG